MLGLGGMLGLRLLDANEALCQMFALTLQCVGDGARLAAGTAAPIAALLCFGRAGVPGTRQVCGARKPQLQI